MKNRRNPIFKCILSIILSLSIVVGGMPVSITADEVYLNNSTTESAPDESQIDQQDTGESTDEEVAEEASEDDKSEETGNTDSTVEGAPETGNGTQDAGNNTRNTGNSTRGTNDGNSEDIVGDGTEQTTDDESTEPAEYTDRNIDITFNAADYKGTVTEDVITNQSVVYVGDTLTAVLTALEGGNASDADASAYTYEWQIQDEHDPEIYYAVENGNSMVYTPMEDGVYRLYVYRPADDVNYINAYEGYFGLIVANLIPVTVTWDPAAVEKKYDGKSTVTYSGTRTVTRDDGSEITNCKETVSNKTIDTLDPNVGSYSVSMVGVGTDLSEDVYSVSGNEVTVNIGQADITATVTVAGKNYDGTTDVEDIPVIKSWGVNETGLTADDLALCVIEGDTVREIQASDFVYKDAGNVNSDTAVDVSQAEGITFGVLVNGQYDANYTVAVSFSNRPTIKRNSFTVSDCAVYDNAETFVDDKNVTWVRSESLTLKAINGYSVAAAENQEFGESAEITINNDGIKFYAKNTDGDIGCVQNKKIKSDVTAPVVTLKDSKTKLFDRKNLDNTYVITEGGSGIKSIRYLITEKEQNDISPDDNWEDIAVDENKECSITLTVPKKGYVYFYTEDNVGNKDTQYKHILVLEDSKPTVTINTDQDALNSVKNSHEISITATDHPDKEYSGIQRIEYKLTDSDNKDVTDNVSVELGTSTNATLDPNAHTISTEEPDKVSEINALKDVTVSLNIKGADSFDGVYKLKLTAFDYCGNESKTVETNLKFDNKAPVITVTPENGDKVKDNIWYFNADEGQQIEVGFSDSNLKEDECKVTLKGPDGMTSEVTLNNPGEDESVFIVDSAKHTVTISKAALDQLKEGSYSLSFSAKDKAENESSSAALSKNNSGNGEESGSESEEGQDSFVEFKFVIDRTAPIITDIVIQTDGVMKEQTFKEVDLLKFNKATSVIVTVKDDNLDANLIQAYTGAQDESGDAEAAPAANISAVKKSDGSNSLEVTFSLEIPGTMVPSITGTDLAGNTLQLAEETNYSVRKSSGSADETGSEESDSSSNTAWWENTDKGASSTKTLIYSDKKPKITLTYEKQVDKNPLERIGKENTLNQNAYYNGIIKVTGVLEDFDESDYELIKVVITPDAGAKKEHALNDKEVFTDGSVNGSGNPTFTMTLREDGKYQISFTADDGFEKELSIIENSPYEGGESNSSTLTANGDTSTYWTLVKDMVSPILSGTITPSDGVTYTDLITTKNDKRYYFNDFFKYSFSINEKYLDANASTIHIALVSKELPEDESGNTDDNGNENTEDPIVKRYTEIVFENKEFIGGDELNISYDSSQASWQCERSVSNEGIYAVYAYGTDLAGNPIKNDEEDAEQKDRKTFSYFFKDEAETTKHVTFTTVVDMENPNINSLGPKISVTATIPTNTYFNFGEPLFTVPENGKIPFTVKVEDQNQEKSKKEARTGLESITYTLYESTEKEDPADGNVVMSPVSEGMIGEEENIWQYTISEDPVYVFQGSFELPVTDDNANRNNLVLVVKAKDRAGNESTCEYYFGVDNTQPEITVDYQDENGPVNEKYFNGPRTAVITVKERNFVDSNILIEVEATNIDMLEDEDKGTYDISDWVYSQNQEIPNGDADTYTATVTFTGDGDYKVNVSGTDAAGLEALVTYSGAAPEDFVIDTHKPTVNVTMAGGNEYDGNYYYNADNCDITVSIDDHGHSLDLEGTGDGAPVYQVKIDGNVIGQLGVVPQENDKVSRPTPSKLEFEFSHEGKIKNLQDGSHTITIDVIDIAGNPAEITYKYCTPVKNVYNEATFILDKTAPKVISISTDASENTTKQITDDKVYDDTKCVYYNAPVKVTLTIEDAFMSKNDFSGTVWMDGETELHGTFEAEGNNLKCVFILDPKNSSPDGATYSGLKIVGKDMAGNYLILDEGYTHNEPDTLGKDDKEDGSIVASYGKVVDLESPVATIMYTSDALANIYNDVTPDKGTAYYNKNVTTSVSIDDNYVLDGDKLTVGSEDNAEKAETQSGSTSYNKTYKTDGDGKYSYTVYGTDRALNPMKVSEQIPVTTVGAAPVLKEEWTTLDEEGKGTVYKSKYEIILDTVAPLYSVQISSEGATNKNLNVSQGNRYYFNSDYKMTVSVTDENIGTERIKVMRGAKTDGTYNSSNFIIDSADSFNVRITCNADENDSRKAYCTDTVSKNNNGVYRYKIYGSDRAGNALEVIKPESGTAANIDGDVSVVEEADPKETPDTRKSNSEETLAELTNHIVVDTVKPVGTYEVSNSEKTYYTMNQNGQVTFAEPYRDETSAQIKVKVDTAVEMTPVKIQYSIDAVPQQYSGSVDSGKFEYGIVVTSAQNGKQKFRLSSLTFTDLAGNVSSTKSDNFIHLDYDIPVVDSIAPTINIVTTATTDCRDGNGQPLFNSDVPLSITVSDPDAERSSSGLADVTYEMYVNESLVSADTIALHSANPKQHTENYTDPGLTFSANWPVNVAAASHNYNNLRVLVTATDNAGFKSTGEYRFGIDVTPPTISVTYDNNDVRNEKYFNADRTATVVVTERNFEAGRISIETQTPSISGWTHASGSSANGDDDTWTATVSYTTDGNYTLAVSGSDRLGWTAGETTYNGAAPTDFVLDKTAPVISITYDNNDVRNEKYYKADRTATITVTDVNFSGENAITVNASGGGSAPGVAFSGSSASLPFTTDGVYSFSGTVTDLAGNVSAVFTEPEFVLDKTKPQISISGVENLSANKVPLNIILKMLDTNLNEGSIIASLTGTNNGAVDISGKKTFIAGGVQYTLDTIQVDDYYQLVFTGIDLAGNEETITISFSENQNGTTFEFVQKEVAGKYTNKTFKPQFILHNVDVVTILSVTVNGKEVEYEYKNNTLTLKDELTSDGKYVIAITTKDAAGNVSTMDPVEFYLDQRAPVISQKGLENTSNGGYKKVYSTPFDLTILHDIPDDAFVVVKLNGKELKPSEYTINADGSITLAIDKYQKYDIEVTVTDAAGNESSAKWEFELTRNPFKLWFSNKPLFYGSLAGSLLLLFLILLLLRRRKDDEEEKEANK